MAQGRRITADMFDENLRDVVMGNTNIIPISTVKDLPSSDTGKMYRVLTGAEKHNIYTWDADIKRYVLIGADDRDIRWTDVMEKPSVFPAAAHKHTEADIIGLDKYTKAETDSLIAGRSPKSHTHTESEIVGLNKYTKEEVNALVALRALSSHIHAMSEITGLVAALSAKVDKVTGKGLSTNDFTNSLKTKLEGLSDSASVSYDAMLELFNAHKDNQSIHLTESDKASIDLVQGKADKAYVDTQLSSKAPLSTFNGHTGNSIIHVTQAEKDAWNGKSTFDGNYASLANVPSTFTPNTHTHAWGEITGKPSTFAPSTHSHAWSTITNKPIAFPSETHTHSYNDLADKPFIQNYSVEVGDAEPASADMWYKVIG